MRLIFCGTGWLDVVPTIERALGERKLGATIVIRDPSRPLVDQLADVDVILPSNAPIGAAELDAAPKLRLVQQPAAGYEGIDRAAAKARNVPVCNAPGKNADAVAQAALLLLLALARRWPLARRAFDEARIGAPVGLDLSGRRLLVVGLGRTGERLAVVARALGMQVEGVRSADGRAGLHAALARADAVSIHCPLTPATRHLFDDATFDAMRPGTLLVNVARGGILERAALERALQAGILGGVGLDVFWQEPWDPADPLFARDDVVTLPHVAGSTEESFAGIAEVVAHNVEVLVRGGALLHLL